MLQKDSETFFKGSRPVKKSEQNLKPFVYVSKIIVLYIDDIYIYIYKTIKHTESHKTYVCIVERDIKNDFMCRCRYCTMVCKKREKENIMMDVLLDCQNPSRFFCTESFVNLFS